ncbi:MAG TPA: hypothetical protein VMT34_12470 [Aggregatilineales bacterium]|nr:hypothetical protein [Aggregatilineales bacterium]
MSDLPEPNFSDFLPQSRVSASFVSRFSAALRNHPSKLFGWLESIRWLGVLVSLSDVLIAPAGATAQIVSYVTIGPHEIGHVLCLPFGQLLFSAGGSMWQVLPWALLGGYARRRSRQITIPLIFWAIAGRSFINLAIWVGDARARQLKRRFGMDSSHRDWYNLLNSLHLLPYDRLFAVLDGLLGAVNVLAVVGAGAATAGMIPRTGFSRHRLRKA